MANDSDKVLNTVFKYSVEAGSQQKVIAVNEKIRKSYEDVAKEIAKQGFATDQQLADAATLAKAEVERYNRLVAQSREIREQVKLMRLEAKVAREIAGDIEMVSKPLIAIGAGLVGGIVASATNYINKTKEINALTIQWHKNTMLLEKSQERIGKVAAQAVLPFYTKLVELSAKVASFAEANPEAAAAGLKIGAITAGIGVIGLAVSKGIKFFADDKMQEAANKMLLAAQLMNQASNKELEAAGLQKASTVSKLGGGVGVGSILAGGAAFAGIGNAASQFGAGLFGTTPIKFWQDMIAEEKKAIQIWANDFDKLFGTNLLAKVQGFFNPQKASTSNGASSSALENSPAKDQIVNAYIKMQEQEKDIVEKYSNIRAKILEDEKAKEDALRAGHLSRVSDINTGANRQIASTTIAFANANKKAEEDLAIERSRIIRDSAIEIERIEEASRERLRKLAEDHGDRVNDLVASRDALGLVKENRAYERSRAEEVRNTNKEIAQRRRDLALRLNDLQQNYERERLQRQADFAARIAEINANRAEQLLAENTHYGNELKALREAKNKELELNKKAKERELADNQQAFVESVRSLDASLLGEQELKNQYYANMLADADRWLAAYRAKLDLLKDAAGLGSATGGPAPHEFGGYATGNIKTGEKGYEYVMPHSLTKIAENTLGSSLSNEALASLFMNNRGNITVNDNSRWNARIPNEDRRRRNKEFGKMLTEVFT